MLGNRWNSIIGFTSFGESHGPAMGIVIEDVKPGIKFPVESIKEELLKRRPGDKSFASSRKETDEFEILSGVFDGYTTGMPICILIRNQDQRSKDYSNIKDVYRPGHADFSLFKKFKIYDFRGGGRASGRETIARVIAGSLVDDYLDSTKIDIFPIQIGTIALPKQIINTAASGPIEKMYWPDQSSYLALEKYLSKIKSAGDSVGGIVRIKISMVKPGLGDPVFEKLDANLAKAILSIGAVKGIEFGDGFKLASLKGSEANDQIDKSGFLSNHAGGIQGGISNGEDILINCVIKPTSSISLKQQTVDHENNNRDLLINGRHDTCIIPRIIPVLKAMIKLVLADAIAYQNMIEDKETSLDNFREAIDKIDEDILIALKRRNEISKAIGKYKKSHSLPILNSDREIALKANLKEKAKILDIDTKSIEKIWDMILEMSKNQQ